MILSRKKDLYNLLAGLDTKLGMVKNFNFVNPLYHAVRIWNVGIASNFDSHLNHAFSAAGSSSTDVEKAALGALGEWYERYSIFIPFPESVSRIFSLKDKPADLNCLSLAELIELQGFHPFQFHILENNMEPVKEDTSLRWIPAKRLLTGQEVWIPEMYAVIHGLHRPYYRATTNGCALAATQEEAATKALLELIERDAFMMFWWRKERPEFIDFHEDLRELNPLMYRAFGPWLRNVHAIHLRGIGGISVFVCMFRSSNKLGHPSFAIAGSAHFDPAQALSRALSELGGIINYMLYTFEKKEKTFEQVLNFDQNFKNFRHHQKYYRSDAAAETIFFIDQLRSEKTRKRLRDLPTVNVQSPKEMLNYLKEGFGKEGFNPILLDQTPRDVRSLGYFVCRALDPKVIDLNSFHSHRRWGKSRLYCSKITSPLDLNQFPHPFP